jgi:hypothetical protein
LADYDVGRPVSGKRRDAGPSQHAVVFRIRHPDAIGADALVDRHVAAVVGATQAQPQPAPSTKLAVFWMKLSCPSTRSAVVSLGDPGAEARNNLTGT